jgi:FO synthase
MTPQGMESIIVSADRIPRQRTTLYGDAEAAIRQRSFDSAAARMSANGHQERVRLAAHS